MPKRYLHGLMTWKVMQCVERYCELANKTTQQLHKIATPCIDVHQLKEEEIGSVGELSKICSQIVLKCLYLARIERPDFLWSVNKLARSITKRTKACDKRLNRLISYIHHTCGFKQYCHVGNTTKQCRLGLFQDSDFAGDLKGSNQHQGESYAFSEVIRSCQTNLSFTQFYRSWNHFSSCRFAHGWDSSSWSLGFGLKRVSLSSSRKLVAWHHIKQAHTKPNQDSNPARHSWIEQCWFCFDEREVFSIRCVALHFWGQRSSD